MRAVIQATTVAHLQIKTDMCTYFGLRMQRLQELFRAEGSDYKILMMSHVALGLC